MIGATADAIDKAEDRERFREAMKRSAWKCRRASRSKGDLRQKKRSRQHQAAGQRRAMPNTSASG
jgi:carbamoylphosphate synthase large subunit